MKTFLRKYFASDKAKVKQLFNYHNTKGLDIKFQHSFQDSINPIFRCGTDVELCLHSFLHSLLFQNEGLWNYSDFSFWQYFLGC